jgi:serine protease inhibitor
MAEGQRWKKRAIVASGLLLGGLGGWQLLVERAQVRASIVPVPIQSADQPASQPVRKPAPKPTSKPAPKPVNPKLVTANTRFGFKLFAELLPPAQNQNLFVSPASVAIALGMLYNGSSGETRQDMDKVLELQGMSLAELNQSNADLKRLLEQPDAGVQLAIANSLWANQGVDFKSDFLQRNRQFYSAQITALKFNPQALTRINQWVSQSTQGKIPTILDQLDAGSVMVLINALYFKGAWSQRFDPKLTRDRPFHLTNGTTKPQPTMSQSGQYRYYETANFQAVSLPYGQEKRVSLYIFLPTQASNLSTFHKTLTEQNWEQWMPQFRPRPGTIELPRFKLEYQVNLNQTLMALGMQSAFGGRANFANLSRVATQISKVEHKTFVEVNEEGTEAAAATAVVMARGNAVPKEPPTPFQMVVDRPFFCAIRDNQTGTILFMGSIVEPK